MRGLLTRGRLWLVTVVFGGTFMLSGCDPNVRDQVLAGVGTAASDLATTFINAFFQSLINKSQEDEEEQQIIKAVPTFVPQIFT